METLNGVSYRIEPNRCRLTPAESSAKARRLLAGLVSERYSISPLPEIAVSAEGKPYFATHPEIHFSLSHCRAAVMAVVADSPVGCDIEDIADDTDLPDTLIGLIFSANERKILDAASDRADMFTRLWTRKEASVKRTGHIPEDPRNWPSSAGITRRLQYNCIFSICTG